MRFAFRLAITTLLFAFLSLENSVLAQDYPSRPVTIIVPFGAGSPADNVARLIAQHLSTDLNQSFVVENKPGGSGVIGAAFVAKAAPDGYTLLLTTTTHTVNESLIQTKPYQLMRDLVPVAALCQYDLMLVVNPNVKAKNVKELIALARENPGKLNFASSGVGSPYHIASELFKLRADVDIIHVPYKQSGDARNNVIGGHVEMMIDSIYTMLSNARSGQVRVLGTTGSSRSPLLPEVPTLIEAGLNFTSHAWLGITAPAGTPAKIVQLLNREIVKIANKPDVQKVWMTQGASAVLLTPEQFDAFLKKEIQDSSVVVNALKLKI